ncbi:MAG: YIP1 family protein [Gaiellaceae bacterium]
MNARAASSAGDELVWLRRALFVLVRPREVLALMRDDSEAAARARSEAVLALVWLSGIASVLWTPTYGHLQDDVANDALNVAVIAFIGGGIYGALVYFLGGLVLYALTRVVGGITYRQVRHVLAFASAPVALSLFVVWPVRLAVYGEDVFKRGGADHGAGNTAFVAIELAFVAWALALLVLGLRLLMRREPRLERV